MLTGEDTITPLHYEKYTKRLGTQGGRRVCETYNNFYNNNNNEREPKRMRADMCYKNELGFVIFS
uniref:Uncharacterized protein n=1 Tax=Romanomermis culicivorax TaxID=13658 RepID=A0A915JCN0_ROMCU